jgi:hypothetical protein
MPRLGTQAGDATLVADLRPTEHDPYLEAALRGTWASNVLVTGSTRRSYTLETYETDIDTTVLSKGVRFGGFHLTAHRTSRCTSSTRSPSSSRRS